MKYSSRALLLSGLAFPGLGQLYLRHWLRGALLALAAATALWLVLSRVLGTAFEVAAAVEQGAVAPDTEAITAAVERRAEDVRTDTRWPSRVLLVLWLGSMVDGWRLGRERDRVLAAATRDSMEQP